jgi:hypothetical protein
MQRCWACSQALRTLKFFPHKVFHHRKLGEDQVASTKRHWFSFKLLEHIIKNLWWRCYMNGSTCFSNRALLYMLERNNSHPPFYMEPIIQLLGKFHFGNPQIFKYNNLFYLCCMSFYVMAWIIYLQFTCLPIWLFFSHFHNTLVHLLPLF